MQLLLYNWLQMIFSSLSSDAINAPLMESVARQVYQPRRG
jgi:hypothetical protein